MTFEWGHTITYKIACAPSKDSDQPEYIAPDKSGVVFLLDEDSSYFSM